MHVSFWYYILFKKASYSTYTIIHTLTFIAKAQNCSVFLWCVPWCFSMSSNEYFSRTKRYYATNFVIRLLSALRHAYRSQFYLVKVRVIYIIISIYTFCLSNIIWIILQSSATMYVNRIFLDKFNMLFVRNKILCRCVFHFKTFCLYF